MRKALGILSVPGDFFTLKLSKASKIPSRDKIISVIGSRILVMTSGVVPLPTDNTDVK